MAKEAKTKRNRKNYGQLPKPAEVADLYWGKKHLGISPAEQAAALIGNPLFEEVFGGELEAIDRRNRNGYGNTMGRPSQWSALQLESVLIYRRFAGFDDIKDTRIHLIADPEARLLLGLGATLPSLPTISRYMRKHFDEKKRAELHMELDRRLRQEVYELPGFDEEARILGMDGSQQGTRYTPPIPVYRGGNKKRVGFANGDIPKGSPGAITAETAGYVGGNHPKSGQGWQLLGLFTEHGTPVSWDISPLNEGETVAAERVLNSYEREVLPHRGEKVSVCTADAGFHSYGLRRKLQELGIVPNIHKASHKSVPNEDAELTQNASQRNKAWFRFKHPSKPHYSNWKVNGHAEIRCSCGNGTLRSEYPRRKKGVVPVVKGRCENCGNITITSGQWRKASHAKQYVRCYRNDEADPTIGNALTFNNLLSREYGNDRFGFGESIHATLEQRFGLLQDKSWMRDIEQVKTEFAIAFSGISVLLLERHARGQQPQAEETPLPPLPKAEANPKASTALLPLAA
jgi:hypothetical protein